MTRVGETTKKGRRGKLVKERGSLQANGIRD